MSLARFEFPWLTRRRYLWLLALGCFAGGFVFGWLLADQRVALGVAIAASTAAVLAALGFRSERTLLDERDERIAQRAAGYTISVGSVLAFVAIFGTISLAELGHVSVTERTTGVGIGLLVVLVGHLCSLAIVWYRS